MYDVSREKAKEAKKSPSKTTFFKDKASLKGKNSISAHKQPTKMNMASEGNIHQYIDNL